MNHDIRRKGRTSQSATIAAASILELHLFTRSAQAQEATGDVSAFQDIASVDGVASVETLDDGSVELTMEDGSVLTVPAGEVQILNGTVFVSDSFLIAQGLTASSNNTVLLLALGAAGVAVAANALESSSDSDDDVVPPVATPPPPPMPPVFTSSATASVAENQTDAYRAVATDADSDTLSYSLSGTDASRFMIDSATGEVRFIEAPDFEAPGDADADNVYDIVVTASDGANTAERTVAIMVTDENDSPVFTSDAAVSVAENQTVAYTALATDADGDDLSYNLSGTDAALFMIDATTGEVRFIEAPDFEAPGDADGDNVYDIVVTASDGMNSTDQTVAITVTDVNEGGANAPPVFTSPASVSVAENQTSAYTAAATDADGDSLTYSLSGIDAGLFTINATTGVVSFNNAPDFESPGSATDDNDYNIIVTASDGTSDTERAVTITVTDVNEGGANAPPVFTSPASVSVAENQTSAYTAAATDADGDSLTYSLSGIDAGLFTINATTGVVSFNNAPDFEFPGSATDDNDYNIIVTASDGTSDTERAVTITVTDVNEGGANAPPVFTSPASVSVAENQTSAYTAAATDADGDSLTYSLSGIDAGLFTINATTGVVSFNNAPDFEFPGSATDDNDYNIIVTASDGTSDTERAVTITVTDVNEGGANAPPVFTSPASVSVAENQTSAYTAAATDADGDSLTYSLSGIDAGLFTINATTGVVSFNNAPDFESPGSATDDNDYNIIVTASDGTSDTERAVTITVTDVNEGGANAPPVFTSPASVSVAENQTEAYTAVATDRDGDPLTYSLSGTDAGRFTINPATGVVRFNEAPDAENPDDANGNNVYDIIVTASDGTTANDIDHAVAITVTGVNDNAPVFNSPATASVEENQTAAYTALATDADGDALRYSLSGTDAARFTINAATGVVSFSEAPDVENPSDANGDNVYDIIVTASDNTGGTPDTNQAVAITVTGVNDNAPAFTSPATASVEENQTAAYTAQATDADGDPLTYSLSGTDAALFTINETTGEVSFNEAPDAENPDDANGDNVYDIIVTASDNTGGTPDTNQAVAITVTGVNDNAPVFTSPATASVAESETLAYTAVATDADGDSLRYSLSGTDAALFTINAATGEVSFNEAPEAENPDDANGDNVYDIVVTATDGTTDTNQAVAITVTDAYDPFELSTLDGVNGFILNGIDADDESGISVSSAGDVNGDGYDDLIIGAFRADPNGASYAGETYVVYGGASAPGTGGMLDLSALDGSNGFILNGIDAFDFSGFSVSSAGDVNGDGYDDLIIGAFVADPNGGNSGETYVVYGGASAPGTGGMLDLSALDGTNGFVLNGIDGYDYSGFSVSSAGDVNGDGYDDLIIGAFNADPNGDNSGETYVVYGGASAPGTAGVLALSALDGTNGFVLNGIDADDNSGSSVSSAGDVNGDGYDDLVIGARVADPNGDNSGETYVVYGGASAPGTAGVLALSALDGTNGFVLNGVDAFDFSGWSVSSAGDVNGDGYDDLIIGGIWADPNGQRRAGESYVVYGGASAPGTGGMLDLSALDGTNSFVLNGIDSYDYSGYSVSSAGDVNGDGYDDLIIGAYRADPKGVGLAGETYVVYGGASAPGTGGMLDLSALDGTNGFILNGIDADDQSGVSVSSAGDVNGDGYDDLIIGARYADPNGVNSAGETYVVYGGATGTESTAPITAAGTSAADNFTGNAGADSFTGIATADVVRGGPGDDTISVTALDFADIDGGTGKDTLVLAGANLSLDLRGPGNGGVDNVEVVDLSGAGANTLVLDSLVVFDLTEERESGVASLDVLGDADDRVDLGGGNFSLTGPVTEDGTTYNVYSDGNAAVRVQNGVAVTLGTMSSSLLSEEPNPVAMSASLAPDLSGLDALMDNGPWNDQWDGLWSGSFQADGLNSLDKPDRHRLNQEPVFEDLSVPDSIPDMGDTGENAVLMPLSAPALTPMAQPVFAVDTPLHNDLAMILQDMEIFADPVKNGDTDMDGF